jgi:hypothetical protein
MGCGRMRRVITFVAVLLGASSPGAAQIRPWDVFEDTQSTSVCDVINAANAELVILRDTRQLVLVSGEDVTLESTFVDPGGFVVFEEADAGLIAFREDGDGFRTLWWTTLIGRAVNVDPFTGEPTESNRVPSDSINVPCDACEFWDDRSVCPPSDDDGPDTLPPLTINLCGVGTQLSLALTALGLSVMSLMRYRPAPPTPDRRRGRPHRYP